METAILRLAKANGGTITPTAIALDGDYSLDETTAYLDDLVNKGYAQQKVRETGAIFYVFPDLVATPTSKGAGLSVGPRGIETTTKEESEARPDPPVTDASIQPLPAARTVPSRVSRATRRARWIPADESTIVAGREIGGMVYVGRGPLVDGQLDNAFIDPSKPVASRGDDLQASGMPYWPNYSSIHPRSRATYLAWLASGRSDPGYNVGYVFLYFYGLERRFFVDDPDRDERTALVAEVERLLAVYGSNGSVRNYLDSFLQAARLVMADNQTFAPEFERSGYEVPMSVRLAIGHMLQDAKSIPAEWALSWLVTHPERRLRTPARRAFPEFKALFEARYRERFPNGFKVTAPRRRLSLTYRAASSSFEVNLGTQVPEIAQLTRPLDRIAQIADQVIDELDKFSRYLGRNPSGRGSIEAHALLPAPLHSLFPCPELNELKAWAQEQIAQGGLVPVSDLVERLEGNPPERIGKRQLTGAADALARLSIGVAPDPRFALRSPKLGEPVVLFRLPDDVTRLEEVSADYAPALLSLVMGTFVAHADGTVSELERRHLTERFESSKVLSFSEKARLRANLDWMMAVPPDLSVIRRRVTNVGEEIRHGLGRLALAVVGADGVVDPAEIKAIQKLYRVLGVESDGIYRELHALAVTPEPVTVFRPTSHDTEYAIPTRLDESSATDERAPIVLDQERVDAIVADTTQVSNVLHAVFSDGQEDAEIDSDEASAATDHSETFAGLDAKHQSLVAEVISRPSWSLQDFEKLARHFGLMPSGALETINEWAFERYEAALIEEDETFEVNPEIVDALAA